MKILGFLSFLILFSANSVLANTVCSTATGSPQYKEIDYNKGIPPQAGDLLKTVQVFVDGKLVSESKYYKKLNPELGTISAALGDIRLIRSEANSSGFRRDYSARLNLEKNPLSQSDVPQLELPFSEFVICTEITIPAP